MSANVHNRRLNLMKAVKSIKVSDFSDRDTTIAIHALYLQLSKNVQLKHGEDEWGLIAIEAAWVANNQLSEALRNLATRKCISVSVARVTCEKHPNFQKALVIRKLENETAF